MKKFVTWYVIGQIGGVFTAFVAQQYWNWFLAPALHLEPIGLLAMIGILWLFGLVASDLGRASLDEMRWTYSLSILDLCVPREQQERLKEVVEEHLSNDNTRAFKIISTRIGNAAGALLAGFLLHLFV